LASLDGSMPRQLAFALLDDAAQLGVRVHIRERK